MSWTLAAVINAVACAFNAAILADKGWLPITVGCVVLNGLCFLVALGNVLGEDR